MKKKLNLFGGWSNQSSAFSLFFLASDEVLKKKRKQRKRQFLCERMKYCVCVCVCVACVCVCGLCVACVVCVCVCQCVCVRALHKQYHNRML